MHGAVGVEMSVTTLRGQNTPNHGPIDVVVVPDITVLTELNSLDIQQSCRGWKAELNVHYMWLFIYEITDMGF